MTDAFWSTARRRSGVLLHPTSLPDDQPLIDSGRRFIDWLADCGFGLWQTLPLHPPDEHGSPYSSCSVYAGHMGLLRQDFEAPLPASERAAFEQFVAEQSAWLHEYARYRVLKEMHDGKAWWDWPAPLNHPV